MSDWKQSSSDTMAKAELVFENLTAISDSPQEAAEILSRVYVLAWLNGRAPNADLENMLTGLCDCIRTNVEYHEQSHVQ